MNKPALYNSNRTNNWNPVDPWFNFDNIFDSLFNGVGDSLPWVNSRQDEKNIYFDLEVPGVKKNEIKINQEGNIIKIEAEKRGYKYSKSFSVPAYVADASFASAKLEDGILTITVPIKEEAKPREIAIE